MSLLSALTKKSRLNAAVKTVAEARKSDGGRQDQLYLKAYAEFQDVVSNDLVLAETLYNWGFALLQQARIKQGDAAIKLYQEASDKFKFCLIIDSTYLAAAIDGGVVFMELARIKAVGIHDLLYVQAREYFERAESIHKGNAVYNLACMHALTGDEDACLAALQNSVKYGSLPSEAEVLQDPDLDKVKDKAWFQEFIASLAKKEAVKPVPTPEAVETEVEVTSIAEVVEAAAPVAEIAESAATKAEERY